MITNITILNSCIISKHRQLLNSTIVWPTFQFKTIVRIFTLIIKFEANLTNEKSTFR